MNYHETETRIPESVSIDNHLPKIGINKVQKEITAGLQAFPKYISSKFFYDQRGSELFEKITQLDEYYPTRTEKSILSTIGQDLNLDYTNLSIIELGSGDHSKISLLLQQIPEDKLPAIKYFPVDISQSAIEMSSASLATDFPMIKVQGIVADFLHQLDLIPKTGKKLFCFFGSTIGNLNIAEIRQFMKLLGKEMQQDESFLLGMDMVKDTSILEKAYNDDKQITAEFNRNILNVINKLANTNFNPSEFDHLAFYNENFNRIEMHLIAKADMIINVKSTDSTILIKKGEAIHTENSHKFNQDIIRTMGYWGGLDTERIFSDDNNWFSLVHYKKK